MALPNGPGAHDESQITRFGARLIWVHHHARITECRALYGVLTGERRTE